MNEHEISTPADIDTAVRGSELRKHSNLWKVAEGRSFTLTEALEYVCGAFSLLIGFALWVSIRLRQAV